MKSPKELIHDWVIAFNSNDANEMERFYHKDAVNHQVANHPVKGKAQIIDMFRIEFESAKMECIIENVFEDNDWGILEWKDPLDLRGYGFFQFENGLIKFQRGYWDKLSFLRMHNLPIPNE